MPDLKGYDRAIILFGLPLSVVFPIASGLPLIGYLVEIAVFFYIILYGVRRMWLYAAIASAGSLAFSFGIYGTHLFVFASWARVVIPAMLFGILISEGVNSGRAFMLATLTVAAVALALFLAERQLIFAGFDQAEKWIQSGLGTTAQNNQKIDEMFLSGLSILKRLLPAVLALSFIFQLFLGWLAVLIYMREIEEFMPPLQQFYFWKMPEYVIFGTGVFFMARLLGPELVKITADNLIFFIGFFYAVCGFSLFEFYLKKLRLSLFLRILFYIGILLLHIPGLILAALVGLFDSYFDFRKVRAKIIG